jgi:hypothetical protein
VAESQMNFGNLHFSGGIQNFGGTNTNTQNNYSELTPREQLTAYIETLRAEHPRPELAEPEFRIIDEAVSHPSVQARTRVEGALDRLASSAGHTRTVAEAVAAIGALVAAHWPF